MPVCVTFSDACMCHIKGPAEVELDLSFILLKMKIHVENVMGAFSAHKWPKSFLFTHLDVAITRQPRSGN